jgi:hypothetical protein
MDDLIEALQIMAKYDKPDYPTHCEHDNLHVAVDPELVSEEDKARLDELGFFPDDENPGFKSYRFGKC